ACVYVILTIFCCIFFFSSRRRHTRCLSDWSSDVCSSDLLLSVPAYVAGGLLFCISGLFNPVGPLLIAISAAAASFGGASGLLWLIQFTRGSERSAEPAELQRSYRWIVAGCIASLIFVAILGPGIRF